MKRLFLCLIGFFIFFPTEYSFAIAKDEVVKVGYYDYEPYFYIDNKGNVAGIYHDIIQLISEDLNFKVDYEIVDFSDAIEKIKMNELDLIVGLHFTTEREMEIVYTDTSIGTEEVAIYTNEEINYGDIERLNGLKLALINDEQNSEWISTFLSKKGIQFEPFYVDTYSEAIQVLKLGQVNATIATVYTDKIPLENQVYRYSSGNVYIAGSKERSDLIRLISNQLRQYEWSDQNPIEGIYEKYIPQKVNNKGINFMFFSLLGMGGVIGIYFIWPSVYYRFNRYRIRKQISNGQYVPYYQPIINPKMNQVMGFEALLRKSDARKGILTPYFFIDELEKFKMLDEITLYMLKKVIADYSEIKSFKCVENQLFYISLNLSSKEIENLEFVNLLIKVFKESSLPKECICLEMIERFGVSDIEKLKEGVSALKRNGFKIAIDDFGVDYSNLKTLEILDFDVLKLDKYFADEMEKSKIVNHMIDFLGGLTKSLNKVLILEGVEKLSQTFLIKSYGYPHLYIQGYFYAKPLSLEELKSFNL